MKPGIFLLQDNAELVEMNEQAYDSESLLQTLLAKYPALLAGNQINPAEPRRWLLIERESAVPSKEGGAGRWLQRIVEFLNEQMDRTEVLAVEVKQFVGEGLTGLVPRVIGRTAEAQRVKVPGEHAQRKDESSFFQEMEDYRSIEEADTTRTILAWSKEKFSYLNWGKASFSPVLECDSSYSHIPFGVYTTGQIEIKFRRMKYRIPAFQTDEKRLELLHRLNEIPGVSLPVNCIGKYPSIFVSTLSNPKALEQFLDAIAWTIKEVKG